MAINIFFTFLASQLQIQHEKLNVSATSRTTGLNRTGEGKLMSC